MTSSSVHKILIVEDEPAISDMLQMALNSHVDFEVLVANDAAQCLELLNRFLINLILMDWMLPDKDGLDLVKELKADARFQQIPVIMLTAKGEEEHKLAGFAGGVEDYVTKPFSPKELIARIRALLKRVEMHDGGDAPIRLCFGPLMLEPEAFRVSVAGEAVALGPTEYRLLAFFMHHPNKVYSRGQLLDKVWGQNVYIEERTVDVHIRRLRKALTPYGVQDTVQTVRGAGYRFSP